MGSNPPIKLKKIFFLFASMDLGYSNDIKSTTGRMTIEDSAIFFVYIPVIQSWHDVEKVGGIGVAGVTAIWYPPDISYPGYHITSDFVPQGYHIATPEQRLEKIWYPPKFCIQSIMKNE